MNTSKRTVSNMLWRFFERVGAQGIQLLVSLLLARLLTPEDFGIVAVVLVFSKILQVFVDSGLGTALIQKKDADELDYSSVFVFNIFACIALYLLLFITAPLIANYYGEPKLVPYTRVLGLTLVISGVKNIQQAYISKNFLFKKFFFATLLGTILSGFIGVGLAYGGCGAWAIIAQKLTNLSVDTLMLWLLVNWRPKKAFSFNRLKSLLRYGWKLLASSLLNTVYENITQLIIGRRYSSSDLAFYNQGNEYPHRLIQNVNDSIDSVLFPTISTEQDNAVRVKEILRRSIKTSTLVIFPMMMGVAVCAEPLVRLLLTEKWLPCVYYLRVFCCVYAFYPIHTSNLNAIKAVGRSDVFLRLEIIKKIIGVIAIFSTMWFGAELMAIGVLIASTLSLFVNAEPNKKIIGYGYKEQMRDLLPHIVITMIMGAIVYPISLLNLSDIIILIIQILLGITIYIVLCIVFKIESFKYLLRLLKSFVKK